MSASAIVGRRDFIRTGAAIGGGLLVSLYAPPLLDGTGGEVAAEGKDFAVNAFVRIGTDESVTVIAAHSEMGQGVYTSLPMLLNEELQADWSKIRVEAGAGGQSVQPPRLRNADDGWKHDLTSGMGAIPQDGRHGAHDAGGSSGREMGRGGLEAAKWKRES